MISSSHALNAVFADLNSSAISVASNHEGKASNVRVMVRVRPLQHNERAGSLKVHGILQLERSKSSENQAPTRRSRRQSRIPTKPGLKSPPSLPNRKSLGSTDETNDQDLVVVGIPKQLQIGTREFYFDAVFPPETTQQQIYQTALGDAIQSNIFKGYNMTVLAYGQTGSGKTHTMYDGRSGHLCEHDGIVRRAIHDLFRCKKRCAADWEVSIALNCLELFNEEFRDLLSEFPEDALKFRNYGSGYGVTVEGVTNVQVHGWDDTNHFVNQASGRRATGHTNMNAQSSRSHAIYTFIVNMEPKNGLDEAISAKLTLVDLAGSEQIKKSGVVGSQQKESININKDLFVLGKVVSLLAERSASDNRAYIPYRDSKLTEFLHDSLGGNCFTVLIACVSPADMNSDESINTLRYAERSRSIANHVKRNSLRSVTLSASESEALRSENERLKEQMSELRQRLERLKGNPQAKLASIQVKMRRANEEAKATKESCLNVASQADRWRDRCSLSSILAPKTLESTRDSDSEESQIDVPPPNFDTFPDDIVELPKKELMRELLDLSSKIDNKRAELQALESASAADLHRLKDQILKEEGKRDQLVVEVQQMKRRIHFLATDLRNDRGFPPIFRTRSEGNEYPGDVEMRPIKVSTWKDERIAELEGALLNEREANKGLQEKIHKLSTEIMVEKQDMKKAKLKISAQLAISSDDCDRLRDLNARLQAECRETKGQLVELTTLKDNEIRALKQEVLDLKAEVENLATEARAPLGTNVAGEMSNTLVAKNNQSKFLTMLQEVAENRPLDCASSLASSQVSAMDSLATPSGFVKNDFFIDNMRDVGEEPPCGCGSSSVFANRDYVNFYLPKIGVTCECGKRREEPLPEDADPTSIRTILRDWQADFLESVAITNPADLVIAVNSRKFELAKKMKKWRKRHGMQTMKTDCCSIALYIWSRTCRVVARSVAAQAKEGAKPIRPDFLNVALFGDGTSISSAGISTFQPSFPRRECL